MILRRTCEGALVGAALVVLLERPAAAQPADDPAAAEALFITAHGMLEKNDWDGACPKFEASFNLHASSSTAINLGRCHAHFGRIASAWTTFSRALALIGETPGVARQKALQEIAAKEKAALEPRLPRLRVVIAKAPPGAKITRDGALVAAGAIGEALPADPGPHEIVLSAPGWRSEKATVVAREAEVVTAELALTVREEPPPTPAAEGPRRVSPATWGFPTAGAGVVAVGVAFGFLAMDIAAIRSLRENCYSDAEGTGCRAGYDPSSDNARKNLGFGVFAGAGIAGAALLAVGTYGIVTGVRAPRATDKTTGALVLAPWLTPAGGGFAARGSFR